MFIKMCIKTKVLEVFPPNMATGHTLDGANYSPDPQVSMYSLYS
jgi:hypothetical protein